MANKIPLDSRICIIGAGPAGLSHGHYLRKAGYDNIEILEINGKVGGKSHSLTFNNRSFDMGANYLTPDYTHVMEMAREVGAEMYHEKSPIAFNPETGKFMPLLKAVMEGTTFFAFAKSAIRYFFIRWKLNSVLPFAGNMGLTDKADLMVSFDQWLDNHNLGNLKRLFSIPTTMMGYGKLSEIPAPYVLRYIGVGTFRTMLLFGAGLSMSYPKRFVDGFQRFWERISWNLNVSTNVDITRVLRKDGKIRVFYNEHRLKDDGRDVDSHEKEYDYLVISCPLTVQTLEPFMTLRDNEKEMFSEEKVIHRTFGITLLNDINKIKHKWRVFHIFPLAEINQPSIFAHQFPSNPAYEIYTPMTNLKDSTDPEEMKRVVADLEEKAFRIIKSLKGDTNAKEVLHYDLWKYFYHVSLEDFKAGYFDNLEQMQGQDNTFYNMGLNSFELIEPITRYSKHLVSQYYVGNSSE